MKTNQIVTASSQIDSSLPIWIRNPDVAITGDRPQSFSQEYHRNFVNFMTKAGESQERLGFSQDLLQNLLKYRDFNTYRNDIILKSKLHYNVELESEQITLESGFGFPDENGVILIDDEVILYGRKEGNTFYDLRRGSSAVSILPTFREQGEYLYNTTPTKHTVGAVVQNLSVLVLSALLDTIHKTFTHNIDSTHVAPEVHRDTLLKYIKDFFRAKGTKLGIKALFKFLFAENDVEVFYPGDRMINPSESTWTKSLIVRVVPIPFQFCDPEENYTTPDKTIGSEVYFKSYSATIIDANGKEVTYEPEDVFAKTYSDYCASYQYGDETQYEIHLNKDELEGTIIPNPSTRLTRTLYRVGEGESNDERRDTTTITVESTLGFPSKGIVFIDNEAIYYTMKTPNQFLNCKRGYIGVNRRHSRGTNVYGPYYVETRITDKDDKEFVSRSWVLGLVESVAVHDPGLLHQIDDPVTLNGPGRIDLREQALISLGTENAKILFDNFNQQIIEQSKSKKITYTFDENYDDELVRQKISNEDRLGYVGNRTHGPDGIFFDDKYVFVSSSGFPSYPIGDFDNNAEVGPDMTSEQIIAAIPRRETIKPNIVDKKYIFEKKGTDIIGIFTDGVRAYSNVSPHRVTQGRIVKINIIDPGYGYVTPSLVIPEFQDDSTELFTVSSITGEITNIEPPFNDTVYRDNPPCRVTSGEGAVIELGFDRYGRITNTRIISGGQYYYDIPSIQVVDSTGTGKGAVLACKVGGGHITSVSVVNHGIDYNSLATKAVIIPVGEGAEVEAVVEYYEFDRRGEVQRNNWKFDDGNGFLYEPVLGVDRKVFGYIMSPTELRYKKKDNGIQHSPIIGWAFDGNPIYGPYGYTNNKDISGGFSRQRSGYRRLVSRLGVIPEGGGRYIGLEPPDEGEYPMGSFIQDYRYDPENFLVPSDDAERIQGILGADEEDKLPAIETDPDRDNIYVNARLEDKPGMALPNFVLDENNGKICNTPDFPVELYPDGVYCYFITVEGDGITPVFPYIIGKTFHDRPISQAINIESQESVSTLPRQLIYKPNQPDETPITFDFKSVERLRNPYLESTKDDVQLEISTLTEGGIDSIIVEKPAPDTTKVGDYVFFDNTGTMGAGAQGVVSQIKGKPVILAYGEEVKTKIISHRQEFILRDNLDSDGEPLGYTMAPDTILTTYGGGPNAKIRVVEFNSVLNDLIGHVISSSAARLHQYGLDNKRRTFEIREINYLDELEDQTILWFQETDHFLPGDVVSIRYGDGEFYPYEPAKIKSISTVRDFIRTVDDDNLYDYGPDRFITEIIDGGKSDSLYRDTLDGNEAEEDYIDSGGSLSGVYPPINREVSVIRAFESKYPPRSIPHETEIVNTERYLYTMDCDSHHYLRVGDMVKISGSSFDEVNGIHKVVDAPFNATYFSIYVTQLYDLDNDFVTYASSSPNAQGTPKEIEVTCAGVGYSSLPRIVGLDKKMIDRAETKIRMNGGTISGVDVLTGGSRYVNPIAVFVDFQNRGSGAQASVVLKKGQVKEVKMIDGGQDYIDPAVYFIEADGKFISTTKDIGKIKSLKVINPGRNISADRSLKPEIVIDTRCVVDYITYDTINFLTLDGGSAELSPKNIADSGSSGKPSPPLNLDKLPEDTEVVPFAKGELVYQGTSDKQQVVAIVKDYDEDRQVLTLESVNGVLVANEPIYNNTGTKANLIVEGQADCRVVVNGSSTPKGKFINDRSMVSRAYAVIQDSYRFQWFSYVISSPLQQIDYGEFVKKIIHPSGFIQFADLRIHSQTQYIHEDRLENLTLLPGGGLGGFRGGGLTRGMVRVGEEEVVDISVNPCAPLVLLTGNGTPLFASTVNGPRFFLVHKNVCVDGEPFVERILKLSGPDDQSVLQLDYVTNAVLGININT